MKMQDMLLITIVWQSRHTVWYAGEPMGLAAIRDNREATGEFGSLSMARPRYRDHFCKKRSSEKIFNTLYDGK
jgi:hypothetical protein